MNYVDTITANCQWAEYGPWSGCSKECGSGERSRKRKKNVQAANGGKECNGTDNQSETCNIIACPGRNMLLQNNYKGMS